MRYIVTANSTQLRPIPRVSTIANIFKNEIVEISGPPSRFDGDEFLKVRTSTGRELTGYVRKDDLIKLEERRDTDGR